jgi:hypothetical protein
MIWNNKFGGRGEKKYRERGNRGRGKREGGGNFRCSQLHNQ